MLGFLSFFVFGKHCLQIIIRYFNGYGVGVMHRLVLCGCAHFVMMSLGPTQGLHPDLLGAPR